VGELDPANVAYLLARAHVVWEEGEKVRAGGGEYTPRRSQVAVAPGVVADVTFTRVRGEPQAVMLVRAAGAEPEDAEQTAHRLARILDKPALAERGDHHWIFVSDALPAIPFSGRR